MLQGIVKFPEAVKNHSHHFLICMRLYLQLVTLEQDLHTVPNCSLFLIQFWVFLRFLFSSSS